MKRIFRNTNIVSLLLFASLLLNCEEKLDHNKYGFAPEDDNQLIAGAIFFQNFIPNSDGTILDMTSGRMWKICSQGQVFAGTASSYSCRGASGGVSNPASYGAKELQYCNVDLASCNTLGLPQTLTNVSPISVAGSSEAYDSCANDNTGGHTDWRVASFLELKYLSSTSRNFLILKFPDTIEDFYWSSTANEQDVTTKTARAVSFGRDRFGEDESFSKTSRYFVRCIR
ncbi:DUF1566 domain-containing protein [Leptospira wolffii]|uniref:surface adhesin Lsa25 n=1 Tax=Leptospira wolffii TaxID=409998 RepID=UPI0010824636|nr:DUF1566 domain-containing protein [Leptospira wolffii]TGK56081.1 DUF1566 domain-containing protein [Leptospira wolffii]TGK72127.1 DUF1566 domain-containing protein [Leptospira wolffii]TGK77431.1 DUF1566 domain-containing protein [Leptospira wolffii]TGL27704.1 DUF1566 domain-containing protein [Leptospira wolffii]